MAARWVATRRRMSFGRRTGGRPGECSQSAIDAVTFRSIARRRHLVMIRRQAPRTCVHHTAVCMQLLTGGAGRPCIEENSI